MILLNRTPAGNATRERALAQNGAPFMTSILSGWLGWFQVGMDSDMVDCNSIYYIIDVGIG